MRFATTINFYSPRAYKYLRTNFSLPHPRSLQKWASSVNCEAGFFQDVFEQLRDKCKVDFSNEDCCLIFDGMSIRKQTIYNQRNNWLWNFITLCQNFKTEKVSVFLNWVTMILKCLWRRSALYTIEKENLCQISQAQTVYSWEKILPWCHSKREDRKKTAIEQIGHFYNLGERVLVIGR